MNRFTLQSSGLMIGVYGTAVTLIWIGIFKFTPTEAKAIEDLLVTSPLLSWMYAIGSLQQVSNFIGAFEILAGLALLAFNFSPRMALVGGVMAAITFLTTVSFLFTSPGMFGMVDGVFVPTSGQFILKDFSMLSIALIVIGESRQQLQQRIAKEKAPLILL